MKKKAIKSKNRNIKIEKPLETDKKHIITKLFLISNKNNNHFCFEKTLGIDQTIENGKQHEKNENQITNIFEDNNEHLKNNRKTLEK